MDLSYYETLCNGCMEPYGKQEGPCPHCGFDSAEYDVPLHQLKPGSILSGKYLVGRSLGEGGFGITYIGFDLNLEFRVAIKEYYPNGLVTRQTGVSSSVTAFTAQGEEYDKGLTRFVQEAKSLAKFHDLNGIVSVKDFFRENGTAYIVMEYIEGETLKQYIARKGGRLPMEEALSLLRPVMESLALVHGAGIIHRDISPDNIMLTKRGAKLIDFGAARTYVDEENRSRTVTLKSGYAPYEQYQTRGEQGPWTDVYALCATIYKCATGVTPPEATDRMAEDTLKPLSVLGAEIDPGQEAVLLKGLAIKVRDRYQDIPQLNAALFQTSARTEPIQPEPIPVPQPEPVPNIQPKPAPDPQPVPMPQQGMVEERFWQKKWVKFTAVAVVVIPLAIVLLSSFPKWAAELDALAPTSSATVVATPTATPMITPAPTASFPAATPIVKPKYLAEERGNTSININNWGYAAQQGDWIYFTEGEGGLYKEKLDGTGRETLIGSDIGSGFGWVQDINVVGDWIYYLHYSGVSRIKTDGSGQEFLFEDPAGAWSLELHIVDDVFYYRIDFEEGTAVCRQPIGGSPQILYAINEGNAFVDLEAVEDGWIYFYEFAANGTKLMKMTLEGKEVTALAEGNGLIYAQVIGDSIYYFEDSDTYSPVYRIGTDGSNKTTVLDAVYESFQIYGDWIYYTHYKNDEDAYYKREGRLYKARLDGSERTQLTDHDAMDPCIAGDWIFYGTYLDGNVHRIKTDGTLDTYPG